MEERERERERERIPSYSLALFLPVLSGGYHSVLNEFIFYDRTEVVWIIETGLLDNPPIEFLTPII